MIDLPALPVILFATIVLWFLLGLGANYIVHARRHGVNDRIAPRALPKERRCRHRTRARADTIARQYRSGALTLPQAVTRLRELEVAADTSQRVLRAQLHY